MPLTLQDICRAVGLPVPAGADARLPLRGASMDSRTVSAGNIFFCIKGERVDGHEYAVNAVQAGAACVVAQRPLSATLTVPVLYVPDTVRALGSIAHAWRERFCGTLVAVTGSAGKTTVKEVLAHVLGQHAPTAKNTLNLNNQIGMPLCVLNCTGEERYWVMEAGISQPHDMDELGAILCPDVALVLNAGGAHAQGLGDKGVAWHKANLLRYVRQGGMGFACADYADLAMAAREVMPHVRLFSGQRHGAPLWASYDGVHSSGRGLYTLYLRENTVHIEAPFRGEYGAENSIAIAAVAEALGVPYADIAQGFATAVLPQHRFNLRRHGPWQIVDDSYNANPLSMRRMLESAREMAEGKPLIAVLGAMGELGDTAAAEHTRLGQRLAEAKVAAVCWRGDFMAQVTAGLTAGGSSAPVTPVQTAEEFRVFWQTLPATGGVVLCKGSRANALEEFVRIMCGCEENSHVL